MSRQHHPGPPYSPNHQSHPSYYHHQGFPSASSLHQSQSPPRIPVASPLPPPHQLPLFNGAHGAYQSLSSSPTFQSQRRFSAHQGPIMSASYEPNSSNHAHPATRQSSQLFSPARDYGPTTNGMTRDSAPADARPESQGKPDRTSNPMSFASILGPPPSEPSPKGALESQVTPSGSQLHRSESSSRHDSAAPSKISPAIRINGLIHPQEPERPAPPIKQESRVDLKPRYKWSMDEKDKFVAALTQIEQTQFSDDDNSAGFEEQKDAYTLRNKKRTRAIEYMERCRKRKRRNYTLGQLLIPISAHAAEAEARFRQVYEPICAKEIADRDIEAEKERKKDAQRKRRREAQIRNEELRLADLEKRQQDAHDSDEADRYGQQIRRAKEKLQRTAGVLDGSQQDDMDVQPLAPNFEGGTTSAFHLESEEPQEPPKKKLKPFNGTGQRPKKSKEKKQAEKDAAEAAYAAGWLEENRVSTPAPALAPREDHRTTSSLSKSKRTERKESAAPAVNYDSKNYITMLEEINREIAKRNVPKVYRIKQISHTTRVDNMRKTAILASKQAKKWQERTNKSMKDTQARAKRVMREMMIFWKRNEREERDQRRLAEKKEIEDAKKAEADREANRQRRKLNFLISQTELYSHFIGKRIKTDEIERATDDPELAASEKKVEDGDKNAHIVNLPSSVANMTGKTKIANFEDLDFDAEDETVLQEAAMANAQKAMDDAQARAREFDADNDTMTNMDNSDMNFMNPTMAGDVQVTQPTMLTAQLKEYQLKGLNWLVNLYEQGINGILADEMGLGKTIQSISVMAYLAEKHNVWGPFLVIAPSSTLHNWQQEITRFVPNLKVLPYWGNAKDRKVLRKFWDRKHITYNKDSEFHVLVTSYQLVVMDSQYFQKIKWQYMILDEAQAIKSSQSSRWKALLGFNCRNRLLLTGTPIQNNMQELWALLHFIMPTLFDSHDEFSEWFSKDIESHAQSNTKLNQDQLKRLHMILKPFMLRRVKAHVQKELGDKVEKDVFCDLAYRQRAYYANLRSKISIMDLLEKATLDDSDQNTATLMNLVMQFRKVCNHPDLFERADTASPFAMSQFAETASFLREGHFIQVGYSVQNRIQYDLPKILCDDNGRLDMAGPNNTRAGFVSHCLGKTLSIFSADHIQKSSLTNGAFSFLRFIDESSTEVEAAAKDDIFSKVLKFRSRGPRPVRVFKDVDDRSPLVPEHAMLRVVDSSPRQALANLDPNSNLARLCNVSQEALVNQGYTTFETAALARTTAPPIEVSALSQTALNERRNTLFNPTICNALFALPESIEQKLLDKDVSPALMPVNSMWPAPASQKQRFTSISVPSMRRFVTDSGKLAKLDSLLPQLKADGHRVLLYFQMTRMIDLMEEYLTYRGYRYVRLDGSTRIEDRRDVVHEFQTNPSIFVFLLSTRAGGLGINLTSADTVIFYDSDWNPTIDSQAMDRAHRLGQTKQVTVYRLITRGTIEERIRKRAMQKEEVQRVVITGGDGSGVDFNTRMPRENRTKDIAMWLADDDQAAELERKEREAEERAARGEEEPKQKKISKKAQAKEAAAQRRAARQMNMEEMYHEGEGNFDDMNSAKASGAVTPEIADEEILRPVKGKSGKKPAGGKSKKAKTAAQRLAIIDASGDMGMGGGET